jgi:7-keto-8-aminopelargonate synthetase-like enzyme
MVVTESVFSMDGDQAPLRQLVELKDKYGAWLMVDEAHATGLYGKLRRGLAEECGVSDRIEIQMGTLGKALGSAGGFICGSRRLIDWLINRARPFIFSTAPVPAAAAAATAAVGLVRSQAGEERRKRLWKNADAICARRRVKREASGSVVGQKPLVSSAIVPIFIGNEQKAVEIAEQLSARGILLPAIRYPAVARGRARLRLTVSAAHSEEDLERLFRALEAVVNY